MRYRPPTLGIDISEVFQTSPGRIDPRTGRLVKLHSFEAIAPWELEERMRSRGRRYSEEEERPRRRRDYEEEERFRELERPRESERPRGGFGDIFRSSRMSGLGDSGEFFGNVIPWVFLGIAGIIALEASGVTHLSPKKVG